MAESTRNLPEAPLAKRVRTWRWVASLLFVDALVWYGVRLLLSWEFTNIAALLAWAATSLFAIVLFYAWSALGGNPGPIVQGNRFPWLQPLFFPYRAVAVFLWWAARNLRGPAQTMHEVAPGLWVGVRLFEGEERLLTERSIPCVVDLTCELPAHSKTGAEPFERLRVPTLDGCPPPWAEFEEAVAWIDERLSAGKSVYVHCAFGRGRSAMVAGAVLLRRGLAADAKSAVLQMRKVRNVYVRGAHLAVLEHYGQVWNEERSRRD